MSACVSACVRGGGRARGDARTHSCAHDQSEPSQSDGCRRNKQTSASSASFAPPRHLRGTITKSDFNRTHARRKAHSSKRINASKRTHSIYLCIYASRSQHHTVCVCVCATSHITTSHTHTHASVSLSIHPTHCRRQLSGPLQHFICMYVYMYIHTHTHTHTTYIYIYIYIHNMGVCVCVYIYIHIYIYYIHLWRWGLRTGPLQSTCAWTRASVRMRRIRIKSAEHCHTRAAQTPKALTLNPKY